MKKIYTAIGQMQLIGNVKGTQFPIVKVKNEEVTPDMGEMILWSTLYWQFLTEDELDKQYAEKKNEVNFADRRSTGSVLYWLIRRGIVAEGVGETYEEALYDLLAGLYMTPISESPFLLAGSFMKMVFREGYPLSEAVKVFRRDKRNDGERTVMQIIHKVRLSAAEVIRCIERGVLDIKNEDEIVEKLYADDYTTDGNIADEMRNSPVRREVLSDVANLYLRRQLVFDRV